MAIAGGETRALILEGRYFDGETAGERVVQAAVSGGVLTISAQGVALAHWPLDDVRMVRDAGSLRGTIFHLAGEEARLNVADIDAAEDLAKVAPNARRVDAPNSAIRKAAFWAVAAVGALALMLFVILPAMADRLAVMIPPRQAERIGAAVVDQANQVFGTTEKAPFCTAPAGEAALAKMTERLAGDLELPFPLNVRVARNTMPNAFAAPGGHVVIFAGLLELAETPEEVAAVLAHEIGHVHARDGMRLVLRAAGSAGLLSLVLGDVSGGVLVIVTEQLLQASHTRAAEAAADEFAHHMMEDAGLPAEPLATLFERLAEEMPEMPEIFSYFASHPELESRAEAARAHDDGPGGVSGDYVPVLTQAEWKDLQAICGG